MGTMPPTLSQEETDLLSDTSLNAVPHCILHLHRNGLKIENDKEHDFLTAAFQKLELQLSAKEESLSKNNSLILSLTRKLVAHRQHHQAKIDQE